MTIKVDRFAIKHNIDVTVKNTKPYISAYGSDGNNSFKIWINVDRYQFNEYHLHIYSGTQNKDLDTVDIQVTMNFFNPKQLYVFLEHMRDSLFLFNPAQGTLFAEIIEEYADGNAYIRFNDLLKKLVELNNKHQDEVDGNVRRLKNM